MLGALEASLVLVAGVLGTLASGALETIAASFVAKPGVSPPQPESGAAARAKKQSEERKDMTSLQVCSRAEPRASTRRLPQDAGQVLRKSFRLPV
jgi:hypothetical protein